ncbi:MAG: YdeI/OmpD-associated family protein [Candidatus Dormibacteria bacterium]
MTADLPELAVSDLAAWRGWLEDHAADSEGVWLVLAKKGTTRPTSLTYDQALEEALCHGWVDGQLARADAGTFRRRFTPRRRGSSWSKRNTTLAERLIAEGRMRPGGLAAVARAKSDGTWEAAYHGAATIEVPSDLAEALDAEPAAREAFERLDGANRYSVLYRVTTANRPETRNRRIEQLVAMLARGETIHPRRAPR